MPQVAFEHYADDPSSGYFEITEGSIPAIHVGMADPDAPDELRRSSYLSTMTVRGSRCRLAWSKRWQQSWSALLR